MDFAMMTAAERDCELVADLAAEWRNAGIDPTVAARSL
jgi:hypothetical protein